MSDSIRFNKTKLLNKDIVFLTGCSPSMPYTWEKKGIIRPSEFINKANTIRTLSFSDIRNIRLNSYAGSLSSISKKMLMFFNIKGGCGKTTTTSQLIFLFALQGYKVLAIDLDGQQDLTYDLGIDPSEVKYSMYDVLLKNIQPEQAIIPINECLHLIGANDQLDNMDTELLMTTRREDLVHEKLGYLKDHYDLIIMDSHPIKNQLNISAIFASDLVIIPTFTDNRGYRGLMRTLYHIKDITTQMRPKKAIQDFVRVIPNNHKAYHSQEKSYLNVIRSEYPEITFEEKLRSSAMYSKASDFSISIYNYKQKLDKISTVEELNDNENVFVGLNFKTPAAEDLKLVSEELLRVIQK